MRGKEHDLNEAAFRRLEDSISKTYPKGHFIAFMDGQIIADAKEFDELQTAIRAAGKDPYQAFIIEAGRKYAEKAIIFLNETNP